MCNKKYGSENCVAEIICIINILQRNVCPDNGIEGCDKPVLGSGNNNQIYNTRPIIIYTCTNETPFSMITNKDSIIGDTSSVFRIEKVEGNCCTFRVLAPNPENTKDERYKFIGTNSFFALNIDCIYAVRCLSDCFIE